MSSSVLAPEADSVPRPRNRRLLSAGQRAGASSSTATSLASTPSVSPNRRPKSPIPPAHLGRGPSHPSSQPAPRGLGSVKGTSWAPTWASIQDLASSLWAGDTYGSDSERASYHGTGQATKPMERERSGSLRKLPDAWGPEPPSTSRPRLQDVAVGSMAERESALMAAKTASILESHPGANGGLDVAGRFKRRNSDEDIRGQVQSQEEPEDHMVYIHHVQPTDTYAGIVLKYRCVREDAFRKANGLWSQNNIQVRKWLAMPVDACEVRGRPCEAPSYYTQGVDLLAPTPQASSHQPEQQVDDFFASTNGKAKQTDHAKADEEAPPWNHVRWVTIDNSGNPVEVARVSRKFLGYFPPRRKKSIHSVPSVSTPRQSLDAPANATPETNTNSPRNATPRRGSGLAGRPPLGSPSASRSRVNSLSNSVGEDRRPVWMRRPGGVGSMGKNVRAPGPEKDYFNSWTKKHIPGLSIESFPSMSVMGSETANFGFRSAGDGGNGSSTGIVESPFADGGANNVSATARGQGIGLDKAAAAVETWLRGAFAKKPGAAMSPMLRHGSGRQLPDPALGDLIELEDASDDGRGGGRGESSLMDTGLLSSDMSGTTGRGGWAGIGAGAVRGRTMLPSRGLSRDKKAD